VFIEQLKMKADRAKVDAVLGRWWTPHLFPNLVDSWQCEASSCPLAPSIRWHKAGCPLWKSTGSNILQPSTF